MRIVTPSLPAAHRRFVRPRHPQRLFSAAVTLSPHAPEVVRLKVGGSGHVSLKYSPPFSISLLQYLTALQYFQAGEDVRRTIRCPRCSPIWPCSSHRPAFVVRIVKHLRLARSIIRCASLNDPHRSQLPSLIPETSVSSPNTGHGYSIHIHCRSRF